MDEKTEKLRDIFRSVTDEETVTESQEPSRGSLRRRGDSETKLSDVVAEMDAKYSFEDGLSTDERCRLIREFYAGATDEELAKRLSLSPETVFSVRMNLHLIRDSESPNSAFVAALREQTETGERLSTAAVEALAEEFDIDEATVLRRAELVHAMRRSRQVSHRFKTAFEELLTDADLSVAFTADAHEHGLADATDGAEVDVEF